MGYLYLSIAILAEVVATSALNASQGFTRLWPSVTTVVGYCIAFYALSPDLAHYTHGNSLCGLGGSGYRIDCLGGRGVF